MSTINDIIWLERTFRSMRYVSSFFWICWEQSTITRRGNRTVTEIIVSHLRGAVQ